MKLRGLISLGYVGFVLFSGANAANRRPLIQPTLKRIQYRPTGTRLRADTKGGNTEYPVAGRISLDRKSGNFRVRWNGVDGKVKTLVFEPPNKVRATVGAIVEYDQETRTYKYSYTVINDRVSKQKLQSLYVEYRGRVQAVAAPDPSWYSSQFTGYLKSRLRVDDGWTWSQTMQGRLGLAPGEKATGFTYESHNLPGIVKCYIRPYTALRSMGATGVTEDLPEELHAAIDKVSWGIPYGVTVGPSFDPEKRGAEDVMRSVLGMIDTSVEQGWITASVGRSVKAAANGIITKMKQGDITGADDSLGMLVARIKSYQQNGAATSEASGLLSFNLSFARHALRR